MIANTMTRDASQAKDFFAKKLAFTTGPAEVNRQIGEREDVVIVDVRDAEDYAMGHVPGAVNLPEDRWDSLEGLRRDTVNVLYCYSPTCHLAAQAALRFAGEGYQVMEMDGGFEVWKENKFKVDK